MAILAAVLCTLSPPFANGETELFETDKLIEAIVSDDYESAKLILIKGHDPNPVDNYRRTPIILAAMAGKADLVELLAENKANLDAKDEAGGSALHYTAARGYVDVAELLIELGADVDIENRQGMTPLLKAAANGQFDIVQLLLSRNADTNHNDYTGRSALMWAQRNGRTIIVRLLRQAGISN